MDIGVDEEVAALHVLPDEFLVLGGVPAADDKDAVAGDEPAEPVVPPLLLERDIPFRPRSLRDRPLHRRNCTCPLLLELLDLVVAAADVLLDSLVDVDLHPLPLEVEFHRCLGGMHRADHLRCRVAAV